MKYLAMIATSSLLFACGREDHSGVEADLGTDTEPQDTRTVDDTRPAEDTHPADDSTGPGVGEIELLTDPPLPPPPEGEELPIEVVRTFDCVPEGVGAELALTEVIGDPGAVVAIRPSAASECQYDVFYKRKDGTEQKLSQRPSGYIFAAGLRTADGTTVVCINDLAHRAEGGRRFVDTVKIECSVGTRDTFTPLTPVVVPDGAWAAWIRTLAAKDGEGQTFSLRYVRDFSFQFFNLSDNGRPATDGVYEATLKVDGRGGLSTGGNAIKVETRTNPLAEMPVEQWAPTEAEKSELEGIIDFSDGPCPEGCPVTP